MKAVSTMGVAMLTLLSTLTLGTQPARASSTQELKNTLVSYQTEFPKWVHSVSLRTVQQYFLMRYEDYAVTALELYAQAQRHNENLKQIESAWIAASQLVDSPFGLEDNSITLYALRNMVERESIEIDLLIADITQLEGLYDKACTAQRLDFAYKYFDPRSLLPVADLDRASSATPGAPIRVTVSFSGEMQSLRAVDESPGSNQASLYEATSRASTYAADKTIGGYKGRLVGALLGIAIRGLLQASEESEQRSLSNQINDAAKEAVNKESTGSQAQITGTCNDFFRSGPMTALNALSQSSEGLPALALRGHALRNRLAAEFMLFPARIKNALADLDVKLLTAIGKVDAEFVLVRNTNLEEQLARDSLMHTFILQKLSPAVLRLHDPLTPLTAKLALRQQLWSDLLEGEQNFGADNQLWKDQADAFREELKK